MTLRLRLALATLAIGLPIAALEAWLVHSIVERDAAETLADFSSSFMQSIGREECEASPETWVGGHQPHLGRPPPFGRPPPDDLGPPPFDGPPGLRSGRPPPPHPPRALWPDAEPGPPGLRPPPPREVSLYAYASDGTSRNPRAPAIDPALLAELKAGRHVASRMTRTDGRTVQETLTSMSWSSGPCALILARRTGPVDRFSPMAWRPWIPPILTVLLAVLLAAGPMVRRIRRLTQEVRRYAASRYESTITVGGRDEVGELARAFSEAGAEIRQHVQAQEAREKALREFLANTTHDVMIPLTVLQGHLASLREQSSQRSPPDPATIASAMSEAHYIGSLVHNLSLAARMESSELSLQLNPVNLNELVSRVVSRHAPLARQKEVALERALPEPPLLCQADVTLAEQAVSNIVFNAVRYNHKGGHVAVLLERASGGQRFLIKVIDDGPGIPEEEMSRLVERNFRGNEARSREPSGHGLGLNIASRAIELHGWTLRFSRSEFGGLQAEIEGPASANAG